MYFWPDWPWPPEQEFDLLHDKILLLCCDPPNVSSGKHGKKVALVKNEDDHWAIPDRGEVLQIGLGVREEVLEELDIGDFVLYNKQKGDDYQMGGPEGDHILIISPDDILANIGQDGPRW